MSKAGDESSGGGYDAASAAAASGGGELAGRKMVEGKSKFSVTCGRLSQYLKNNGSFGDLKLGISHSFQPQEVLLDLVNIGTLFVFYMVANAVVFRRYVAKEVTNPTPTITFLLSFSLISLAFTVIWHLAETSIAKVAMLCLCAVLGITAVQSFKIFVPQARKPEFWGVPFMPWVPAFSIFLNLFLMGDLNKSAYIRFLGFTAVILVFYALYGVHASFDAEKKNNGNVNSVSLVIDTFR